MQFVGWEGGQRCCVLGLDRQDTELIMRHLTFRVDALLQEERSGHMPQVVVTDMGQPCFFEQWPGGAPGGMTHSFLMVS